MDGFIAFSPGPQLSHRRPEVFDGSYHFWERIEIHRFGDVTIACLVTYAVKFFHFSCNPQKRRLGPQLIRQALGIRASMLKSLKLQESFHFFTGGIGWMDCPLAETE
jgi:hypothetical protein